MKIHLNTDHSVDSGDVLSAMVDDKVHAALDRFDERLTRIEVHLSDVNGEKHGVGADKRCLLEARPSGLQPVVVTEFADTFERAVGGASKKMQSLLTSTFGRIDDRHADATIRQAESH